MLLHMICYGNTFGAFMPTPKQLTGGKIPIAFIIAVITKLVFGVFEDLTRDNGCINISLRTE